MKVTVIGPAIIDVLAAGVGTDLFSQKSHRMDDIRLSFGGNALNEAIVLSRLGVDTELVTKIGDDEAGNKVFDFIKNNGISSEKVIVEPGLKTGVNVVLINQERERFFLTDPNSSLRKMTANDVTGFIDDMADIVCFPCMFTSPLIGIPEMTELFSKIKNGSGRTLILDMTNAKNNETIDDLAEIFSYADYFLPNEEELKSISGGKSTDEAARQILSYGTKAVIVKCGGNDTKVYTKDKSFPVSVYKAADVRDTTGAGDSFGAGFIYGQTCGMSLKESVLFGNAVASCTVEKTGATDGIISKDKPFSRYNELLAGK